MHTTNHFFLNSLTSSHIIELQTLISCTNTSNPSVIIGAGLLAKNSVERGLKVKPEYLVSSGLMPSLEAEVLNIFGIINIEPGEEMRVVARDENGKEKAFNAIARLDSPIEVEFYRNGGILHTFLRNILIKGGVENHEKDGLY